MTSSDQKREYLLWLTKLKLKDGFMDSSCYAAVSLCLKSLFKKETFRLPYFILDEELRKEQNNVREMTSGLSMPSRNENCTYVSPVIKQLLILTLQLCEPNKRINSSNYMSHLRSFLGRPRILPINISNPLNGSSISFHCLPTECKLYILNMLFHQTPKVLETCTHLGTDSVGNKFFLAQDARVYAALKNESDPNLFEEFDGKSIMHEAWGDLYRFIKTEMPRWKMVAESEQDWDVMQVKLTSFDESELWARMKSHKKTALAARTSSVNDRTRAKERNALSVALSKLINSDEIDKKKDKIPDDPSPERAKKLQSKIEKLEKELRTLKMGNTSSDTTTSPSKTVAKRNIIDPRRAKVIRMKKDLMKKEEERLEPPRHIRVISSESEASEESTVELSTKRQERCRFWPKCRESDEECIYIHPRTKCSRFPYCPYGSACLFLHGTCRNDGVCTRESCPYEHTLRRSVRAPPCKFGAQCFKVNCTFTHPPECTRRACPGPSSCSFYHPPVQKRSTSKASKQDLKHRKWLII